MRLINGASTSRIREDIFAFWVARKNAILSSVFEQAIVSFEKSNQSDSIK